MLSFSKSSSRGQASGHNVTQLKEQIVDKVSPAIMTVDRDFMVTYVMDPPGNC